MKTNDFREDGYEFWDKALSLSEVNRLKCEIDSLDQNIPKYGIRFADQLLPSLHDIAHSAKVISKIQSFLSGKPKLVRAVLFNKPADQNWFVPWHQDRTLPINKEFQADGWKNWTQKRGVPHAEAPTEVLQNTITLRLHLDRTTPENGGLKFIPSSHHKKLSREELENMTAGTWENCKRDSGDAFIMRPLLLHSSNKSKNNQPRRVIHLEYSAARLPKGIHWATSEDRSIINN